MKRILGIILACCGSAFADTACGNPAPAAYHGVFREAPLTAVKPTGSLRAWLETQRDGLGTHYAVSGYPYDTCLWAGVIPVGGNPEGARWWPYEQSGYLVDGLGRLGILLDDRRLEKLLSDNVSYAVSHPRANGLLGPECLGAGQWGFCTFARALMAAYGRTGDRRIVDALARHCEAVPFGQGNRDLCIIESLCWLYDVTGDRKWIESARRRWSERPERKRKGVFSDAGMCGSDEVRVHGVTGAEIAKLPALLYLYGGDPQDLASATNFFEKVMRDHALVDGMPTCDEPYRGPRGMMLHETCSVNDGMWAFGYLLAATGDAVWADRIERIFWNAGFGCVASDFKSFQYFSSPNQVYCTDRSSHGRYGPKGLPRMAYRPGNETECCAGNVHRIAPTYVARMWMTAKDGGPVATLYGPSVFTCTPGGTKVVVTETTDYPHAGDVVFDFTASEPVETSFSFRVPAWADGAVMRINGGAPVSVAPGRFHTVVRRFASGDRVSLDFPLRVRQERFPAGTCLVRGAVVYALPVAERVTKVEKGFKCSPACPAWELRPGSEWNWGLPWFGDTLARRVTETRANDGTVHLRVPARRVTNWIVTDEERTPETPERPVAEGPEETLELVPYARTRLRVSAFPEIAASGKTPFRFPRATPESQGIRSTAVSALVDRLHAEGDMAHGYMLLRHGKVVAEGWWAPYGPRVRHALYSISKAFTSMAIGYAVEDRKMTLNDRVNWFFPEYVPSNQTAYAKELRVRDLMQMASGHRNDPLGRARKACDGNWAKAFYEEPVVDPPGLLFRYMTGNSCMLAQIHRKVTGAADMISYLRPRLFDRLDITDMHWDRQPDGTVYGGSGFFLQTEDLAKVAQLLLQGGVWKGERLLPLWWVKQATACQTPYGQVMDPVLALHVGVKDAKGAPDPANDWQQGYGYQMWMGRHETFRLCGAYGQIGVVMPNEDLVFVVHAGGNGSNMLSVNALYDTILPSLSATSYPEDPAALKALRAKSAALAITCPKATAEPSAATLAAADRFYDFPANDRGLTRVKLEPGLGALDFSNAFGRQSLVIGSGRWTLGTIATDKEGVKDTKSLPGGYQPVAAAGAWIAPDTYRLDIRYLRMPHGLSMLFRFVNGRLEIVFDCPLAGIRELTVVSR